MRRTRSTSSSKNSSRTGEVACAGNTSTASPCTQNVPGAVTSEGSPASV